MIKIFIVDDEPLVRIGIKSTLLSISQDYEIIGEASNGLKAVEKLREIEVDVIFTDIKMPEMNGIELIKWLNKNKPDSSIIVLSCFQDFDYVKQAFFYGAADYILKYDINNESIKELIGKIEIKKNKRVIKGDTLDHEIIKSNFIKKLLIGQLSICEKDIESKAKEIGININSKSNHVIVCMMLDNLIEDEKFTFNKLKYDIFNSIKHYMDSRYQFELFAENVNLYFLIVSLNEDIIEENFKEVLSHVQLLLSKYLNLSVSFGISKFAKNFSLLSQLYHQSLKAINKRFFYGPQSTIHYQEYIVNTIIDEDIKKLKSNIMDSISNEQFGELVESLNKLKQYWIKNTQYDVKNIKYIYGSLIEFIKTVYYKDMENIKIDNENIIEKVFLDDIHNEIIKLIENISKNKISIINNKNCSKVVNDVIMYINTRYNDYGLNLNIIANKFNYTASYLSRIFKNETGMNLIDYINEVKIYKAKQMLKDHNIKVYQVAEKVGYKNYNYFSKIFKKICGVSPSDF